MSEKELRAAIEDYDVNIGLDESAVAYDGIIASLAADPDVVEVARELEKWAVEERALSDMVADFDSSVATAALNQSVAYHAARIKLQLRFGFHLTDDGGWEWVE